MNLDIMARNEFPYMYEARVFHIRNVFFFVNGGMFSPIGVFVAPLGDFSPLGEISPPTHWKKSKSKIFGRISPQLGDVSPIWGNISSLFMGEGSYLYIY